MIYLKPKNVGDVTDYKIGFVDLLPVGFEIGSVETTVTEAGNTESPRTLIVDDSVLATELSPPGLSSEVVIWLSGGTAMTWYLLKIEIDDGLSPAKRKYTRYAKVQVREDV
jgi:hypothetical protein